MNYWNSPETTSVNREPMLYADHSETLILDGEWDFQLLRSPLDSLNMRWGKIPVPGLWTMQPESDLFWDKPIYTNVQMPFDELPPHVPALNPTGIYERDFSIPEYWTGTRFIIHIGGFESVAILSINESEVGMAKDSRLAAEFDITSFLKPGKNRIQIKVVKWSDATFIEDQDQWWHGGITRSIKLYATPETFIQKLYLTPGLKDDLKTGTLLLRGNIANVAGSYPAGFSVSMKVLGLAKNASNKSCQVPEQLKPGSILEEFEGWMPEYKAMWSSEYWDGNLPAGLAKGVAEYRPTQLAEVLINGEYKVLPWSAESPQLYKVVIELSNPEGKVIQSFRQKVGFRDTRVVGHDYLFNYQPIILYGINRHDFNPRTGRVLSREYIREDLLALKAFNFNAIRTAHYPNDPALLEIADEMGFYVIGEANIEAHAFQDSICDDPRYLNAFVDRIGRMAARDISHPSVIFWSLGNETGSGPNHAAAAAFLRRFDPSRPLHYEGAIRITRFDQGYDQSDVICPMYPSIQAITSYGKSSKKNRPLIMCEYSHAMGNSNGTLAEYWEAIHGLDGLQGGFIWEFWDHAILQTLPDGSTRSAYGGDFGEERHDGSFVCDGMFWSNRQPKPAMYEMKNIASPIEIARKGNSGIQFTIVNRLFFTDTSNYAVSWEISIDGKAIDSGTIKLGKIKAREKKAFTITSKKAQSSKLRGERFITFSILQSIDREWAEAGTCIGERQFTLKSIKNEGLKPLPFRSLDENNEFVNAEGEIVLPLGVVAPSLNLFRAPTENDTYGIIAPQWRRWGLDQLTQESVKIQRTKELVLVKRTLRTGAGISIIHRQSISKISNGFSVTEKITIPKAIEDLPRVGITFEVSNDFSHLKYFGCGPVESYPDRSFSPIRICQGEVSNEYIPYVVPQESGGHHGVRWFELSDSKNRRFRIEFDKPRQLSVLPYSQGELINRNHDVELTPSGTTVITMDASHRGIGTASCGPDTLEKYLVKPGVHTFAWSLKKL